jgi:hypothetical protein
MVQAVHVENLTEGSEWSRGQRWHGNQSFECVRKNRKAEKNGSVRQEPDRKGAKDPPLQVQMSHRIRKPRHTKKTPRVNRGAFELDVACGDQHYSYGLAAGG